MQPFLAGSWAPVQDRDGSINHPGAHGEGRTQSMQQGGVRAAV